MCLKTKKAMIIKLFEQFPSFSYKFFQLVPQMSKNYLFSNFFKSLFQKPQQLNLKLIYLFINIIKIYLYK
jgi:hypothetical protein